MNNIDYLSLTLDQVFRSIREIQYTNGLLPVQWEVLRYLARANKYSLTPTFVANFLGTTKGTASQTLYSLENKGYICRTANAKDKRVVNLALTKAGSQILESDPVMALLGRLAGDTESRLILEIALTHLNTHVKTDKNNGQFGFCKSCKKFKANKFSGYCALNHENISNKDVAKICAKFVQVSSETATLASSDGTSVAAI